VVRGRAESHKQPSTKAEGRDLVADALFSSGCRGSIALRSFSRAARFSSLNGARYSSMVCGLGAAESFRIIHLDLILKRSREVTTYRSPEVTRPLNS
jgi:hypothetical protein